MRDVEYFKCRTVSIFQMFPDHHDSYSCHNGNSNEEWRSSTPQETKPFCMNYNKQPVEVSVNSYPVATIEVDQVPSLFNISPCGPVYKYVGFFFMQFIGGIVAPLCGYVFIYL